MDPLFTVDAPRRSSLLNVRIIVLAFVLLVLALGVGLWKAGYLPFAPSNFPGQITFLTWEPWAYQKGHQRLIGVISYTPSRRSASQLLPQKANDTVLTARVSDAQGTIAAAIVNRGVKRLIIASPPYVNSETIIAAGADLSVSGIAWAPDDSLVAFARYFLPYMVGPSGAKTPVPNVLELATTTGVVYTPPSAEVAVSGAWEPAAIGNGTPIAVSPDGRFVLVASTTAASLLDRTGESAEMHIQFPGAPMQLFNAVFSPDGQFAIVGAIDGKNLILVQNDWANATFTEMARMPVRGPRSVVFSPTNELLIYQADGRLHRYNGIPQGAPKEVASYHLPIPAAARLLTWTPAP